MSLTGRSLPLVALVLALGTLIASARIVATGETWSDVRYHTEIAPPRLAAAAQIQSGQLPAWWDGTSLGVPLAGEPSHGAMAPAIWLATSPRVLDLLLVAHLFWLALGIAVWARRTTSETAAVVAGLLAITAGVIGSTAIRGALPALAHLPWLGAFASMRGTRGAHPEEPQARMRGRWSLIGVGVALGAIGLGGQLAVLVDGVALVLVLDRRPLVVLAIGAGLVISLAQWLPALLAIPHMAGATVHGMPLSRLVELVVPGSFGSPDPDRGVVALGGAAAWAPSVYIGAPLLALAAVRPIARRMLGLVIGIAALALVTGRGGWPAWLGAPELHLAVLAIVLAPLAAGGVDALVAGERRAWRALAIGGACSLIALGALGIYRGGHDDAQIAIDRALLDGGLGIACIAAALAIVRTKYTPIALALLVAPGFGAMRSTSPTDSIVERPRWAEIADDLPTPRRLYRPESFHEKEHRFEPLDDALATLAGESADRFGIAAARSDDPARQVWHDRTWLAAAHGGGVLLDRFGITLAILPTQISKDMPVMEARGRWSLVHWPGTPTASTVSGARFSTDPQRALALMFQSDGKVGIPRGTIVIAGTGDSRDSAAPPVPCRIAQWVDGDIDLECTAATDGYAVISSSSAPGWLATVDGRNVPVLDADVIRRAVAVTAGPHAISWSYSAPGLLPGIALSLLGLLSLSYMLRPASRASS